jgi:hypothetical protein
MRCGRALFGAMVAVGLLALPQAATAQDVRSDNMTLLKNLPKVDAAIQSDLAFQGSTHTPAPTARLFRDNPQTRQ